ncbi:MAG: hypothetical protein AAGG11_22170 [Pseudomonadota bacterium]
MVWFKRLIVLLLIYVGIVVVFESLIGVLQPQSDNTMVLTSAADGGATLNRVVTRIEVDGRLYAAVNHWPRAWYGQVLEDPEVNIAMEGASAPYRAANVTDPAEFAAVQAARPLGMVIKLLTGFPPRRFVRFDPAAD